MITKKELTETLALSCVESYFLAWLKNYCNVSKLYANSFISVGKVFKDFEAGATYENYSSIPRLQDTAEKYGLTRHSFYTVSGDKALDLLKQQSQSALCLIQVNDSFFKDFKRAAWRNDHFICVDQDLRWVNQYPLSEGQFDVKKFFEIYAGRMCIFETNCFDNEIPLDIKINTLQEDKFVELPNSLLDLESAIGVLRVLRKRLEKYYEVNKTLRELLRNENDFLDKFYFNVHFSRLKAGERNIYDADKIYSEFYGQVNTLIKFENEIIERMKDG